MPKFKVTRQHTRTFVVTTTEEVEAPSEEAARRRRGGIPVVGWPGLLIPRFKEAGADFRQGPYESEVLSVERIKEPAKDKVLAFATELTSSGEYSAQEVADALRDARDRLPWPAFKTPCGAKRGGGFTCRCTEPAGHDGNHADGSHRW